MFFGKEDLNVIHGADPLKPLDVIEGFQVRPGLFRMVGAYKTGAGVSFTIYSHGATSCTLLLFRPMEQEPYAKIPFPDRYRIGNTWSMIVYGLSEDFEYAFQMDGRPTEGKDI